MALKINELRKPRDGAMYTSPKRICVNADDELVEPTDPTAIRLLVGEGCQIPNELAEKYGLIGQPEEPRATPAEGEGQPVASESEPRQRKK